MPTDRMSLLGADYGTEAHNGLSNMDLVNESHNAAAPLDYSSSNYHQQYDSHNPQQPQQFHQEFAPYQQNGDYNSPQSQGGAQFQNQDPNQQRFQSTSTDPIDKGTPPPYWEVASPSAPPPGLPEIQREDYSPPDASSSIFTNWLKIIFLKHWWTKCATLCWWAPFIFMCIFLLTLFIAGNQIWNLIFFIFSTVFAVMASVHYIIQVFCNPSARYLSHKKSTVDSYGYVDSLKREAPRLYMSVSCYHYETRTRTVTSTDAQGRTTTRVETYQERVTTYSETTHFPYAYWVDASGVFRLDASYLNKKFIKLRLFKKVIFNDEETAQVYTRYSSEFRSAHRWRDVHMDYSEGIDIPGFKDRVLASVGDKKAPWVGFGPYFLASVCCLPGCLQLPYLWCFESVCGAQQFTFFKRVSLHPYVDMSQSAQHDDVVDIQDIHFKGEPQPL
mmetsp:Transcript_5390/g.20127  ORF Transcript_5390/g.20127 Transcript_5390/m.20127 type:complete len:444 (-) Transcript_5390:100-1431(-)|eukprot:CAMPEP_0117449808 /NCGR_PEP_ID=MMETSP0759-20121206/8135_1 /TAXON_ID=63605 /ORGANISM="Percolomonas cosmopolitus, Strain WS" /LENGTH=443 /DNA_ID=CAMNT_0005242293 /DNA_START=143 /DNA_END=1474 /DNA_ORIENTATION=+